MFGQDECIFKQFSFTPKAWALPNGQKVVIPKDEGARIMISGLVSMEFEFEMEISHNDIEKVNRKQQGSKYSDEKAAETINGNTNKQPLKDSPFMFHFDYGATSKDIGIMTQWSCNLKIVSMLSRCCTQIMITFFYLITVVAMIDRGRMGSR